MDVPLTEGLGLARCKEPEERTGLRLLLPLNERGASEAPANQKGKTADMKLLVGLRLRQRLDQDIVDLAADFGDGIILLDRETGHGNKHLASYVAQMRGNGFGWNLPPTLPMREREKADTREATRQVHFNHNWMAKWLQ